MTPELNDTKAGEVKRSGRRLIDTIKKAGTKDVGRGGKESCRRARLASFLWFGHTNGEAGAEKGAYLNKGVYVSWLRARELAQGQLPPVIGGGVGRNSSRLILLAGTIETKKDPCRHLIISLVGWRSACRKGTSTPDLLLMPGIKNMMAWLYTCIALTQERPIRGFEFDFWNHTAPTQDLPLPGSI